MLFRKLGFVIAAASVLTVALAACGSSSSTGNTGAPAASPVAETNGTYGSK